ncbi:MAG TPA: LysR family transcriptional regulator [Sphingobium sp.]|nr:LysR family transcriptional regulator [Sphingobium sp.]
MSIRLFCSVAELKSFSAAAERLGLSAAMASKHVMHLERRLSTRLLNRTSRHVSLTEAGALYFEQARIALEDLDTVEAAVNRTAVTPRGTIRFSAPVWMANPRFAQLLADYRALHPEVRFDVDLSDRQVSLVNEGFDLALRVSRDLGQGLVARKLAEFTFKLVAAPSYLARAGRPESMTDLNGHAFLIYSLLSADTANPIPSRKGGPRISFVPVLRSGNETLLHHAVLGGQGLACLPTWLIEADLQSGHLVAVLPEEVGFTVPLFAVYPSRNYLSAKVRTFLDFMAAKGRLG